MDWLKKLHDWAAQAWWRAVLVSTALLALGGVADHFLGQGNFVDGAIANYHSLDAQ